MVLITTISMLNTSAQRSATQKHLLRHNYSFIRHLKETMSTAAKSSCEPCKSLNENHLLNIEKVQEALQTTHPMWDFKENSSNSAPALSRKFTAKNFMAAMNALNAFGDIAEREGHHPDFHLTSYREVEVVLYTHKLGGITENDLILAKQLDEEVNVEYSPKWLKAHPEAQKRMEK